MEVMTDSSTTVGDSHAMGVPSPRDQEVLELIDRAIRECAGRDIVSAVQMADMLLDIRLFLMTSSEVAVSD